ncbi:MAG: hypothetical protein H6636_13660 [Anaerolineales bacterium]|nr:hypothetical protein [Anaerolineales bacterium]
MDHDEFLQQAIQLARNGERVRARKFFLDLIEADPKNLTAWAWLVDLLDDLEDRIYACEQVLAANPNHPQLRAKYQYLLEQRTIPLLPPPPTRASASPPEPPPALPPVTSRTVLSPRKTVHSPTRSSAPVPAPPPVPISSRSASLARSSKPAVVSLIPTSPHFADPLDEAQHLLSLGQREEARKILLPLTKTDKRNERLWLLVSEATEDETKQITALTNALRINPENIEAQQRLKNLRHFRDNPLDLAALYEEEGKFDEAIEVLHRATLTINYGPKFDRIYEAIERLEKRKTSGVVHIRPNYSIARLTFGPPVLFFLLMLVHNHMNPFVFTPLLWLGVVLTFGGGFLLALANVRSRHPLWVKLFDEPGASGSPLARFTVSLAGWLLIFVSFTYLFQLSFERLSLVATNTFLIP